MSDNVVGDEPYLLVEEVAERLGLPLSVLLHRVEAGDIPSKRVDTADGVHYALRLGDLGIELDDHGMHSPVIDDDEESTLSTSFERPEPAPESVAEEWAPRPREPQEPPTWMLESTTVDQPERVDEEPEATAPEAVPEQDAELPLGSDGDEPAAHQPAGHELPANEPAANDDPGVPDELDEQSAIAELAVPPPSREPVGLFDASGRSPSGDLSSMSLDARELVAGLLDRWERTLEQRIYTEQRQRFQAELATRQNMVKELQMELQAARAEHAAAQAEKDRILAAKERELADRERDLADSRRHADEVQQASRRRRWFRGRDD